ncbi:reverse transcriptase domain-containing protein [Tanacetum coccineum]
MQTRSSSKFIGEPSTNPTSTNPKCRNHRRSKQRVEPFSLVETPVVTMVDQRTMAELVRAPTDGYAEAIVVPPIPVEHFEVKHSLINLVTSKQFFGFEKEYPHAHIRYFNKITSTLKYKDVLETSIKLMLFPFSIDGETLELANTPLNENCSSVILKKLPEKLGDPRKFLIQCSFSELNCKALADLGASINLMPLSVWKKLGLSELISTRMTFELANRSVCIPARIARDVFVPVGRFTFPANFVIVDYESDPRVPLILGRPFLRTARALINVHGEELILRNGDERLILNMKHGTSKPNHSLVLTSSKVKDDIFDPEGDNVLIEKLLNLDSTKDLPPNVNLLSGSTTSSYPSLTTS